MAGYDDSSGQGAAPSTDHRQATLSADFGHAQFYLVDFVSDERLSQPYAIEVHGLSKDEIDFLPHLAKPVCLDVGETSHVRYFHGLLVEAAFTEFDGVFNHYRLTLRPWLHLLTHNRNYRIFQNKSVKDIVSAVFQDAGFNDFEMSGLTGAYDARDYCVQYRESDFDFVSRLMEHEGIYYYFRHEKNAHKMVLCDNVSAHHAAPDYDTLKLLPVAGDQHGASGTMWSWIDRVATNGRATVTLRSYDFERPQNPLQGASTAVKQHPSDALEIYDNAGDFIAADKGKAQAKIIMEAARAERRRASGVGDAAGLACGGVFTLNHAEGGEVGKFMITALRYEIAAETYLADGSQGLRQVHVETIPSDTVYRAPLRTPRPVARGPETAMVTGANNEVIDVDQYGRVKVLFNWDRSNSQPGQTSCWIRVSHPSAGEGFGHVGLPRVGQEVVVDFLEGDPDRPLITGRVYNAQKTHTYALPDNKTRSHWRSQTVGEAGSYDGAESSPPSGKGFNEIRFEDKGGSEEVYVHAQRNMLTEVQLDDEFKIQRDRKARIGRDRTTEIKRNETTTIETGDQTHKVSAGKRVTTISQNDELTVEQGSKKTTVSMGDYTITASAGEITVEAAIKITLKVGTSTVVLDNSGVTVQGVTVTTEGMAQNNVKAPVVQVSADAMASVQGGLVKIN